MENLKRGIKFSFYIIYAGSAFCKMVVFVILNSQKLQQFHDDRADLYQHCKEHVS